MIDHALVRTISANVRRLAAERGIALAHLADRAGIGRTTMWRLLDVNERGPSDPRLSTIVALACALDVEVIVLLAEERRDRDPTTRRSAARSPTS